jgi:unsaturated rhamnogalacturonyl hydrolase
VPEEGQKNEREHAKEQCGPAPHVGNVLTAQTGAASFGLIFMKYLPFLALLAVAARADTVDLTRIKSVADYEIAHPASGAKDSASTTGWVLGAFYAGLSTLDRSGLVGGQYHSTLLKMGEKNGWKLGRRVYHSDDMCVGQTYLDLYETDHDPRMVAAMKERCDQILAHPKDNNLAFVGPEKNSRWSWCDAIFMGPPGWVHLSAVTHNPAYLQYTIEHYWKTSAYLFDSNEHLFFRDSTYFDQREPNGRKVFWSRGNGWVLAGLARLMEHLPADSPSRSKFEAQFQEIAARVLQLQQADGSWASSLLDPQNCQPRREFSGTGFFCYGFAWGVNHGLLPAGTFAPAARKAWAVLNECVEPSGRINHVQPIGAAPTNFPATATEAYGPGSYLLAATELSQLK